MSDNANTFPPVRQAIIDELVSVIPLREFPFFLGNFIERLVRKGFDEPQVQNALSELDREGLIYMSVKNVGKSRVNMLSHFLEPTQRLIELEQLDQAGDKGGGKGKGTRKPEQYKTRLKPLEIQVYERIQQEHVPNAAYADTVERLSKDNPFMEQFKEAGYGTRLKTKFVRKVLAYFDTNNRRNKQQTKSP